MRSKNHIENIKNKYLGKSFNQFSVISIEEVVVERGYRKGQSNILCVCKCACGNIRKYTPSSINKLTKKGRMLNCGCVSVHIGNKYCVGKPSATRKELGRASAYQTFLQYKAAAKRRNIDFNIDFDIFLDLTKRDCVYCGSSPKSICVRKDCFGDYVYNGIDRINSKVGYQKDNCVSCCKWCNFAKSNRSKEEFFDWIEKIYKHLFEEREVMEDGSTNTCKKFCQEIRRRDT